MGDHQDIWVFSEKAGLLFELIGGARGLADQTSGQVAALVLGPRSQAEQAIARGADQVYWLGEQKPDVLVDDFVPTLAKLITDNKPGLVIIGATQRGRAVAGRLAARLDVTTLADVKEFLNLSGPVKVQHMIFGGGAVRIDQATTNVALATVGPGVFDALQPQAGRSGDIQEVAFVAPEKRATYKDCKSKPPASVNLSAAKKVVCAGRGIAQKDDLQMVTELAQLLGAELGCSRPLAEGLDWLPRERYIGVSGANIKPDLYMGVGVSGQVQHTVGMSKSRVVVTINQDPQAPLFAQSDYGIVGDLYQVVPALIDALKERK